MRKVHNTGEWRDMVAVFGMIKRAWAFLKKSLRGDKNTKPANSRSMRPSSRSEDVEMSGRWFFKKDILDCLDDYIDAARQLKKLSPDTYDLYSKTGAVLASSGIVFAADITNKHIMGLQVGRTSFGAFVMPLSGQGKSGDGHVPCKIICFERLSTSPWFVEPFSSEGFVYQVSMIWLKKNSKVSGVAKFYVHIGKNGDFKLLRERGVRKQVLPRSGGGVISHSGLWQNDALEKLCRDQKGINGEPVTPQEFAKQVFCWAYSSYREASMDVRVAAFKGGVNAVFSVDLLRVPYFFNDRERVVGVDGKTRKIFHIVRPHKRVTGKKQTYVKSHFRGLRSFCWNGYMVNVSMPGFHHPDVLDSPDISAVSLSDDVTDTSDYLTPKEVGDSISKRLAA